MKVSKIEIDFPVMVNIDLDIQVELDTLLKKICNRNVLKNQVMWPSSYGSKPIYIPITAAEEKERGIEFDDTIFHVGCSFKIKRAPE